MMRSVVPSYATIPSRQLLAIHPSSRSTSRSSCDLFFIGVTCAAGFVFPYAQRFISAKRAAAEQLFRIMSGVILVFFPVVSLRVLPQPHNTGTAASPRPPGPSGEGDISYLAAVASYLRDVSEKCDRPVGTVRPGTCGKEQEVDTADLAPTNKKVVTVLSLPAPILFSGSRH